MTLLRPVNIVYEDQRAPAGSNFGPHALLLACVGDHLELDRWKLKSHVNEIPKKGVGKVLAALRKDGEKLRRTGRVFALVDDDRIREHLNLGPAATRGDVARAIRERCGVGRWLHVFVLARNTETLVEAATTCLKHPPVPKSPLQRDKVLNEAAADRGARDCILDEVPSFRRFTCAVAAVARPRRVKASSTPA